MHHPGIWGRGIAPLQHPSYQRPQQSRPLIPGISAISRERIAASPCMWLSHTPTPLPHLTACRASELSVRVAPASFPLSLPSLAGSPVFVMEDSTKMVEVARASWPHPRSVAPQYRERVTRYFSPTCCSTAPVGCIGLFAAKAVASLTGSHLREGV